MLWGFQEVCFPTGVMPMATHEPQEMRQANLLQLLDQPQLEL